MFDPDGPRVLKDFGDVLRPKDAEPPILGPAVRSAVHGWIQEIRARGELSEVGVKPRKSCILFGPPGTGKTTLAHHLSARLGMDMLRVRADQLTGKYMGQATQAIAKLFDAAENAPNPLILFLDEIEGVGASRDKLSGSGADNERMMQMGVLLQRLERFDNGLLIGATNKQGGLDDALWRRFDLHLSVDLPAGDEVFAIAKRYLEPFDLEDGEIWSLADGLQGAAPALIRQFCESLKRTHVLDGKAQRVRGMADVLEGLIAAVAPHPSYDKPPLWGHSGARGDIVKAMRWPMVRGAA